MILVHRKPLLDQWIAQLALFLGISPKDVGQIGAGKHRPNGRLDVAMIQSLVRAGQVDDLVASYGHVLVDECHHVSAVSFERVLSEVKARYVTGLTATPQRRRSLGFGSLERPRDIGIRASAFFRPSTLGFRALRLVIVPSQPRGVALKEGGGSINGRPPAGSCAIWSGA